MIIAAADGSSLSNPGPAGWAWYVSDDIWAAGGWAHGTNNMGELMAVLDLLQSTAHTGEKLRILCDSQYVINSLTKWLPGWKRRGWKKGDGKPVLNVELMKELDLALAGRDVAFEWVKGHAGHDLNEAADERARAAATAFRDGVAPDTGPGFPRGAASARSRAFQPGTVDEAPDLFSIDPPADEAAGPSTPGTASPRVKAQLGGLTRRLLDPAGPGPADLLHPDFVAHAGGRAVTASDFTPPDGGALELLAVDAYSPDLVGVRWRSAPAGPGFALWQKTPPGWRARFAHLP